MTKLGPWYVTLPDARPKTRRHDAVLDSALKAYRCPLCGSLGDIRAGIAHVVASQYDARGDDL